MKLRTQLLVLSISFIIGITGLTVVNAIEKHQVHQIIAMETELLNNISAWKSINIDTVNLLNGRSGYYHSRDYFLDSRKKIETSITELSEMSGRQYLAESVLKKLEGINNLWKASIPLLNVIEAEYLSLENTELQSRLSQTDLKTLLLAAASSSDETSKAILQIQGMDVKISNLSLYFQAAVEIVENVYNILTEEIHSIEQGFIFYRNMIITLLLVTVFVAILIFSDALSRRVGLMKTAMDQLAHKDLTSEVQLKGKDEISSLGNNFNKTLKFLNRVFSETKQTSSSIHQHGTEMLTATDETAVAITQISKNISSINAMIKNIHSSVAMNSKATIQITQNIDHLSTQTSEQSRRNQDTSSAIEEMDANIRSIVDLSENRRENAEKLYSIVSTGGERVAHTNDQINQVVQEIDKIREITGLITDIAAQTNILSMNAAIESAHAGEAGKGFSVVAEEIRQLAESTSESALQIDGSLEGMIEKIQSAKSSSTESSEAFSSISTNVNDFTTALTEIVENMQEVKLGSNQILQDATESTEELQNITNNFQSIESEAKGIQFDLKNLEEITEQARLGIEEIRQGIQEIDQAMVDIRNLNIENESNIKNLNEEINQFHL